MAKKKTYYDHLRAELGELLDKLELDNLQKQSLKRRWLDQVVWADKKADECRRLHYRFRLTTIIGGVILPALVGVNMQIDRDNPIARWFPYVPFALSQVVAVSAALAEFGSYGDRWKNYRKMAEDLKAEGWQYIQLSGSYEGAMSHEVGYAQFAGQVENVIKSDVKNYIATLQQKQSQEDEQVKAIVQQANQVAQETKLFAPRPKPIETLPPASEHPIADSSTTDSTTAYSPVVSPTIIAPPGPAGYLQIIRDTTLKLDTLQSQELPDTHKVIVSQGSSFGLQGQVADAKNHFKVTLTQKLGIGSYDTWYVYAPDVQIIDANGAIVSPPTVLAVAAPAVSAIPQTTNGAIKLPVPYLSQRDNIIGSWRTCNTSSCAMAAKFLGCKIAGDDEYYQVVIKYGDTTDHGVQTQALSEVGIKSTWHTDLDFDDLDKSLASGLPVVIGILHHGSLDAPTGGHMIVVIGRMANGDYVINDPYGDLNTEYEEENGESLIYTRNVLDARWLERTKGSGWGRLFYDNQKPDAVTSSVSAPMSAPVAVRSNSSVLPSMNFVNSSGSDISRLKSILNISSATATTATTNQIIQLITVEQLIKIAPQSSETRLYELITGINETLEKFNINTALRIAHFLAQVAHESGSFQYMEEIASGEDYEGRHNLGNIQPGDGVKFKGRGLIQLTGRDNYQKFSTAMNMDFIAQPELVAKAPYAVLVAGWFWHENRLNPDADQDDVVTVTKVINGGDNGLDDRRDYLARAKSVLNC